MRNVAGFRRETLPFRGRRSGPSQNPIISLMCYQVSFVVLVTLQTVASRGFCYSLSNYAVSTFEGLSLSILMLDF